MAKRISDKNKQISESAFFRFFMISVVGVVAIVAIVILMLNFNVQKTALIGESFGLSPFASSSEKLSISGVSVVGSSAIKLIVDGVQMTIPAESRMVAGVAVARDGFQAEYGKLCNSANVECFTIRSGEKFSKNGVEYLWNANGEITADGKSLSDKAVILSYSGQSALLLVQAR